MGSDSRTASVQPGFPEWVLGQQHHKGMQKLEEELQERGSNEPMGQQLNFQAPRNKDVPSCKFKLLNT